MKSKKLIVSILIFAVATICLAFSNKTNASSVVSGIGNLKTQSTRVSEEDYYDYLSTSKTVSGPYKVTYSHTTDRSNSTNKTVWKIVSSTDTLSETNLYCVRAGLGFASGITTSVNYDLGFKLDEEGYQAIRSALYITGEDGNQISIFKTAELQNLNSVLWILDNMLLEEATDKQVQDYLVENAGYEIDPDTGEIDAKPFAVLSRADIEVIQQLAIWYFTNQDQPEYARDVLSEISVKLSSTEHEFYNTGDNYVEYEDIFNVQEPDEFETPQAMNYGTQRQQAAAMLYSALINGYTNSGNVDNTKLYKTSRDVTVYLSSGENGYASSEQQPVVQVKEKEADIALRKFISKIGDEELTGTNSREPIVDTTKFNTEVNGIFQTTAIYNHPKNPVSVKEGDIVTYTIRLYNEGEVPAYIQEVTDYLPEYLEFYYTDSTDWVSDTSKVIKTTKYCQIVNAGTTLKNDTSFTLSTIKAALGTTTAYLKDIEIPAATYVTNEDETGEWVLSYVDIEIKCKVVEGVPTKTPQTNIAEVTKMTDSEGTELKDRDSRTGNVTIPTNETDSTEAEYRPDYTGGDNNENSYFDGSNVKGTKYYPGQQDDDDFDKVVVGPEFDLALRKFITAVGDTAINSRYPVPTIKNGDFKYVHPKDPVSVATGDIVTYTIRVYNEGEADGYANEITDDLPEGLKFLPDNEINEKYRWVMLDEDEKVTTDVSKAKYIVTDYLSEQQEEETGRDNLLKAYDKTLGITKSNPDYRDIKVAFEVTYKPTTKEETKRVIINVAQISADSDDDIDSVPSRKELYDFNDDDENEDDIDFDNVIVKYFDLALLKWVSQTQVTLNGETVITNTGHTVENARNEDYVKLEIAEKDLNKVIIKYIYTIQVFNEGELEGYATELRDHVPAGLKFIEEDNTEWRWREDKDGTIVTDYLKDTLLSPLPIDEAKGEVNSATVNLVLTWINSADNLGEKINYAEISKDKNDGDVPDIDSTPDNMKEHDEYEDDEDDAPVILTIKTGTAPTYFMLTAAVLVIFASGVALIKKYVL